MNQVTPISDKPVLQLSEFLLKCAQHACEKYITPRVKANLWDGFLEDIVKAKIEECGVPQVVTGRGLGEFLGILKPQRKRLKKCS